MLHNIVTNAEWPKAKRRNAQHTRQRIPRFPTLYAELRKMAAGQTVQVEMTDGQEAETSVQAVRNALSKYKQDLRANFKTRTDTDGRVLTLSILKKYGVK
tara:strand:- start:3 stop:302 length:300 start_codon:yes stop_codon:yes gene_type:complete